MQNRFGRVRHWHRRRWCFVLSLTILPATVGCTQEEPTSDEAPFEASSPVPVRVAKAQMTTLRPSIDLVGILIAIPERTAIIATQIEGRIKAVSVVEGEVVESGQTLVLLDERPAKAEKLRAQAVVSRQRAVLDRLTHGYLPQEIESAKQDAQKAKAELESLRLRVVAATKLFEKNEMSDVEYKRLKSMVRRDKAAYAAALAKLDLYEVGTRPESIAEAKAQLDVANAELARAGLAVDFCTISTPVEGVVTQLLARQGMQVVSSNRLATVVDLAHVFVQMRVPSQYLSSVKIGASAEVSVRSLRDEAFHGKIARFSGQANPNTGDVQAYAILQNPEGLLRPGLACRVRISLPPIEQALIVPVSAIADRDGVSVLHVVRDGKAYEIQVSIGASMREYVQVIDSLSPGDLVITKGGYGLPEGCRVTTSSP